MKRKEYIYGLIVGIFLLMICTLLSVILPGENEQEKDGKSIEEQVENEQDESQENIPIEINNPDIRVLIMTSSYTDIVHTSVNLSSDTGLIVSYGEEKEKIKAGEMLQIVPEDERFQNGSIRICGEDGGEICIHSVQRGCGEPTYGGIIELQVSGTGIVVVNELPVEDYLRRVVPSEMPTGYELEALKAQAVCARSYAYRQMQRYAYPEYEAHVNDSTDFQVYGNSLAQAPTDQAIAETAGQVVWYRGQVAATYYFSTSCGRTTDMEAWGTPCNEGNQYLSSIEVKDEEGDYEKDLPWYRWSAVIPADILSELLQVNTGQKIGKIQSLEITKTGAGGVALQICASGEKGSVTVDTENKIRRAFGGGGYTITKQDGSEAASSALLPSAFFTIRREEDTFILEGGGYGHGVGMSQNGANEMAKKGKNYTEILTMFFQNITVGAEPESL